MAGGIVVAGELWVPGQKLISIPSGKRFMRYIELVGEGKSHFIGVDGNGFTVAELYRAVMDHFDEFEQMSCSTPMLAFTPQRAQIQDGWHITEDSYQHIHSGTIIERETQSIYATHVGWGSEPHRLPLDLEPQPMERIARFVDVDDDSVREPYEVVFEDL